MQGWRLNCRTLGWVNKCKNVCMIFGYWGRNCKIEGPSNKEGKKEERGNKGKLKGKEEKEDWRIQGMNEGN